MAGALQRRRVQRLDHLDDAETNALVNRMFGNEDGALCDMRPWAAVWQCREEDEPAARRAPALATRLAQLERAATPVLQRNSRLENRGLAGRRVADGEPCLASPSSAAGKPRLASVYGSSFDMSELREAVSAAGAMPSRSRG